MREKNRESFLFVEELNPLSLFLNILPFVFKQKFINNFSKFYVYYIDANKVTLLLLMPICKVLHIIFKKFNFKLIDVKDEEGNLLRLRVAYKDLAEVQKDIMQEKSFKEMLNKKYKDNLPLFLVKQIAIIDLYSGKTIWRALLLIQIVVWWLRKEEKQNSNVVLFLNKRAWFKNIRKYGLKYNLTVISAFDLPINLKRIFTLLSSMCIKKLKEFSPYFSPSGFRYLIMKLMSNEKKRKRSSILNNLPKICVQYYGHLNLNHKELHSDLFFSSHTHNLNEHILLSFDLGKSDPLDTTKIEELSKHNVSSIAMSFGSTVSTNSEVFHFTPKINCKNVSKSYSQYSNKKWFKNQISLYRDRYNFWHSFFLQTKTNVYVSWYKYDSTHCVITDVLRDLGGISTIYQRAFEEFPSAETMITADIVFGFSKIGCEVESKSRSVIPFYVITGYLGDFRFPLLKKQSQNIRNKLMSNGAKKIITYFDEGSAADERWHTGHNFMRYNYKFLLEKLLENPEIGLIFKPKTPFSLRSRLGEVLNLLEEAEKTGRCYIFESGKLAGSFPPAIASIASDVTIHGHLCAATAGLEAALSGAPTILMDREGWPKSKLYNLELGKVVFNKWDTLWDALQEHMNSVNGMPGFGDWSSMIDELDPFRDGKASDRMGTYLKWILEGFKDKKSRDNILADAAERYCKKWGYDKVVSIGK